MKKDLSNLISGAGCGPSFFLGDFWKNRQIMEVTHIVEHVVRSRSLIIRPGVSTGSICSLHHYGGGRGLSAGAGEWVLTGLDPVELNI